MKGNAGGVAAAAFEGVEGGLRKSWYLVHLFTYVFLIRILFLSTDCSEGGICKSYFSILFHSLLPFLIWSSYYSDLLFSFTDYRKRYVMEGRMCKSLLLLI